MVVALLAVYTVAFRLRPSGDWTGGARAAANRLQAAANKATGPARPARGKQSKPAPAPTPATGQAADSTALKKGSGWDSTARREPEVWGSDPFVRDWVMVNELAELSLKAITLGGDKPYALINDQILEEGDQISGKRIIKIESDKVILEQGGRTFNLLLGD
jgi:hypothetical protein